MHKSIFLNSNTSKPAIKLINLIMNRAILLFWFSSLRTNVCFRSEMILSLLIFVTLSLYLVILYCLCFILSTKKISITTKNKKKVEMKICFMAVICLSFFVSKHYACHTCSLISIWPFLLFDFYQAILALSLWILSGYTCSLNSIRLYLLFEFYQAILDLWLLSGHTWSLTSIWSCLIFDFYLVIPDLWLLPILYLLLYYYSYHTCSLTSLHAILAIAVFCFQKFIFILHQLMTMNNIIFSLLCFKNNCAIL